MYDNEQTEEESLQENWALQTIFMVLLIAGIYGGTVWVFTQSGWFA